MHECDVLTVCSRVSTPDHNVHRDLARCPPAASRQYSVNIIIINTMQTSLYTRQLMVLLFSIRRRRQNTITIMKLRLSTHC